MATKRGRKKGGKNKEHMPPGLYIAFRIRGKEAVIARTCLAELKKLAYKAMYDEIARRAALYEWAAQEEMKLVSML